MGIAELGYLFYTLGVTMLSSSSESSSSKVLLLSNFMLLNNFLLLALFPSSLGTALIILFLNSWWKSSWTVISKEEFLLNFCLWDECNHICFWACKIDSLSSTGFRRPFMKDRMAKLYLFQRIESKLKHPFLIFLTVSQWYSDSNGVFPSTIWNRVTPSAQRSTLSSYPPPI